MEEPTAEETTVEEREELMVSPFSDGKPNSRTAHFLKPTLSSMDEPIPNHFSLSGSFLPHTFEPKNWPLKVCFNGLRTPMKSWLFWVDILRPKYQRVWKKAGIFEAIMSSTCLIKKYDDLVIGLAEKWNPEINTFIFPWGEATISLEDVMVLGGYSVIGFPVTFPGDSQELKEVEDKLLEECRKIQRDRAARRVRQTEWIKIFMGSGRDIEHEALLSLWLSRFVFQNIDGIIRKSIFPIACRLARGEAMALGPAVLARIYRDLTLLKETIVGSTKFKGGEVDDCVLAITLWSPMQLVQLWAWERFPALQPKPNVIHNFEPRSARWSNVKIVKVENVRMVLDSAGETFNWRPYAKVVNYWQFHEFYKEKEEWISIDQSLSKELLSFALCLRPSELVGLGSGCVQQYLPHRVAMQFGIDQDIPCHVARFNETPEIAWNNYLRPINDRKLYIPSRFFKSEVTIRYLEWWKKLSMVVYQDVMKGIVRRKRSSRKRPERIPWVKAKKGENDASVPPGFPPKLNKVKFEPFVEEVKPEAFEVSSKKASVTTRPLGRDKCSLANVQFHSPSMAHNGGFAKMELSLVPKQEVIHVKAQNEGSARVRGGANESEIGLPSFNNENISRYGESNITTLNMIASRLEARVARIERVVAELKAAGKFERNPIKEDS
ncbi:PREDICTED: uncharacterized protein LOC18593576 [Theobroma cacao]|uniref:Uncharacterized protein LOC18593576 n=1 Tax=Theobroma cacao TaxID=3641 RepID=A0AB32WLT5_THECC|nr:PREDICTED: uncharacterized protein LOC18593576 [Theobroma cacao]